MSKPSLKKRFRKFIPFPKRKTIRRWFPDYWAKNSVHMLHEKGITLVFDVGANVGQYGTELRSAGYRGKIISFEPQSAAWEKLSHAARKDQTWIIEKQMALGETSGTLELNVMKDNSLSSFLPFVQTEENGGLVVVGQETVDVQRLDDVAFEHIGEDDKVFLKIDVQGFEKEVLAGAKNLMKRIDGINLEMALAPVYAGETYYVDFVNTLRDQGFALACISPVTSRLKVGRWHQLDGMFFKEPWLEDWPKKSGFKSS